jgi:hypothetical protein
MKKKLGGNNVLYHRVVKILISRLLIFILFLFLLMSVRFQVSVFSGASGLKSGQFDQ